MKVNVHGYSWVRNASGARAISSIGKARGHDGRGRNSKEDISVCPNCTKAECRGKCAAIEDARK